MMQKRKSSAKLMLAMGLLFMTSACAGTVEPPKTVSDFCLNAQRLTVSVEGEAGQEDAKAGNQFDTDKTVFQVFAHNATVDQLCPSAPMEPPR